MKPTVLERHRARSVSESCVRSVPETVMVPLVGLSMPAMRFNSVVLPEPDGPMRARNSPSAMSSEMLFSTGISSESRQYDFETACMPTSAMDDAPSGSVRARLLLELDRASGREFWRRLDDHLVAGRKTVPDFHHAAEP